MTTLTHQDKLDLNRRARAHGLPDLWPEAEVKVSSPRDNPYLRAFLDHKPPPWMTETAAEAVERFKGEGGLTTPRKGFLRTLFGFYP